MGDHQTLASSWASSWQYWQHANLETARLLKQQPFQYHNCMMQKRIFWFMKKKWARTKGSIHIWWRASSLFCGRCTHSGGVSVRGHSGGFFRVSEVCGMVCNMSMVINHKVIMYPGWCTFYSYWENAFRFIGGVQSYETGTGLTPFCSVQI